MYSKLNPGSPSSVMSHDKTWLPVYPPSDCGQKPDLPSLLREPFWNSLPSHPAYSLSTHIIPAAFLRSTPEIDLPVPPHPSANKETRYKHVQAGVERLLELRREESLRTQQVDSPPSFERRLWICFNRYVRKDLSSKIRPKKGLTLICAHANGFNKETWEPMIYHLLSFPGGQDIEEIWAWEAIQHGDSGLLNRGKLSSLFHWFDGVRDMLNFIIHFMPSTTTASLPVHLPRISTEESARRLREGLSERTLIGVGHSLGGCITARACLAYPKLYSAIILIDPVIVSLSEPTLPEVVQKLASGALGRRASWPSKNKAHDSLSRSAFFRSWDSDALGLYVECGMYHDSLSSEYKLKLDPVNEATVFTDSTTGCGEMWDRMHELDDKVEIKWIMPGDYNGMLSRASTIERVKLRPANCLQVAIPGSGHLIVQEKPRELAAEIANFLFPKYAGKKAML
ncbi:alpha/beta-hydrolase [Dendrothele bispora CBS 962.96]|uniref:Alpha/beta-hydrolase n=1 Tax=Dendrothele bispora (strain CBS 962.96) TaxID=1314807 RepID=A0A4S8LE79_DENBC|nr:alpha/beta-hydrolase [Dendrothele bispora CBS 962.96]